MVKTGEKYLLALIELGIYENFIVEMTEKIDAVLKPNHKEGKC